MSVLMHDASVKMFGQLLRGLDAILDKAATHCAANKIEPAALINARLFPDMFDLKRQVQLSCDFAVRAAFRIAGHEPPRTPDEEMTIDALKARIAGALAQIEVINQADFSGSEARSITFPMGAAGTQTMTGPDYLFCFAIPNFTFHVSMVYAILRENGVVLGKRDFMGTMPRL